MWWIFGLINVLIILLFAWFFDKKIKEDKNKKWTLDDKCSFGVFIFLAFVSGCLGTLLLVGLLIFLFIDFIIYIKK